MAGAAIIGYGYWGKILERYIEASQDFDLLRVCSRSLSRVGKQTNKIADILEDSEFSAVFVATPIGSHYEIVKLALEAGKDVFCEKPLATKCEQALELVEMANSLKRILVVDLTYTFSRALRLAKDWVQDGLIGELRWLDLALLRLDKGKNPYWALGTHLLSVIGMFWPLSSLAFDAQKTGSSICLSFNNGDCAGLARFGLECFDKKTVFRMFGENGNIKYQPSETPTLSLRQTGEGGQAQMMDESHNLRFAVSYFSDVLSGEQVSNMGDAVEITRILESLIAKGEWKSCV